MATPGTSRSGRVLKKNVRLLDLDTEYKTSPTSSGRTSTTPKVTKSLLATSHPIVIASPVVQSPSIANILTPDNASAVTPIKSSSTNSLKLKLNISGDIKTETKPALRIIDQKVSTVPATSSTPVLNTPKGPNTIVLKLNSNSTPSVTKRTLETGSVTLDTFKKLKTSPEKVNPTIPVNNILKATSMELPKKVLTQPLVKVEPTESASQSFKAILSPSPQDNKAKLQQPVSSATPKINTVFSGNILARSIQEQKRINQRARQLAQQSAPSPIFQTPKIPPPRNTASNSSSRSSISRSRNNDDDDEKKSKRVSVSPYVLWCREVRSEYQSRYPDLDFINLSKKMGEIWHTLAQNEKDIWFKKAKMLTQTTGGYTTPNESVYMQDWISDDLKPKTVSSKQTLPINTGTVEMFPQNFFKGEHEGTIYNETHPIGTEIIDVHAYLNILGDSLETIGSYIQRGVKYNSQIDYSQSTALSTLLDSALVAMGSLTCLTRAIPKIAPSAEKMNKTLEDISYFMPPSDLSYDA